MGKINSNILFTPSIYFDIFDGIMTENSEFHFKKTMRNKEDKTTTDKNLFSGNLSATVMSSQNGKKPFL